MPRHQGDACDIGAFELEDDGCAADFNGDGVLNLFDFLAFRGAFADDSPDADLAEPRGILNLFDFLAFQTAFGNEISQRTSMATDS